MKRLFEQYGQNVIGQIRASKKDAETKANKTSNTLWKGATVVAVTTAVVFGGMYWCERCANSTPVES